MKTLFCKTLFAILLVAMCMPNVSKAQGFDSTQIGKEYPYKMPFLGKKAYTRGYKIPKPHGIMVNGFFTKQNIILENFQFDFTDPGGIPDFDRLQDIADLIVFGPSTGNISTANVRVDTWVLPFLNIGGMYGRMKGEQVITLTSPIELSSTTPLEGEFYGLTLFGVVPVGPFNIAIDYTTSWVTNKRLDEPVRTDVAGIRAVKLWPIGNKPDMFIGAWLGMQFQKVKAITSGNIPLNEAIDPDGGFQQKADDWYNGLNDAQKALYGDRVYDGLNDLINTTVHYKFTKRLEYEYNMVMGGQWQINPTWQLRAEYGFLKSKRNFMVSLNYRFGL
jgi:hypothetical protein